MAETVETPLTYICAVAALTRERPMIIDFMIKRVIVLGDNRNPK
jgi:hypothetical protein